MTAIQNDNDLNLLVTSFNMGNAQGSGLENLIPTGGDNLDIFALGFQESTYKTDDSSNCADQLEKEILGILGSSYYLVNIL